MVARMVIVAAFQTNLEAAVTVRVGSWTWVQNYIEAFQTNLEASVRVRVGSWLRKICDVLRGYGVQIRWDLTCVLEVYLAHELSQHSKQDGQKNQMHKTDNVDAQKEENQAVNKNYGYPSLTLNNLASGKCALLHTYVHAPGELRPLSTRPTHTHTHSKHTVHPNSVSYSYEVSFLTKTGLNVSL